MRLGHTVVEHDWTADVAVIWSVLWNGRMAPNQTVFEEFRRWGRPVIVIEVGCLDRGRLWRVSVFDAHGQHYPEPVSSSRAERLGVRYQDQQTGENVVIVCQRTDSLQWQGCGSIVTWIESVVKRIRLFTSRPIIVRPHPRQPLPDLTGDFVIQRPVRLENTYDSFDFDRTLAHAHVIVNHNASPGVISVLRGVPVITGTSGVTRSLAQPVSIGYDEIESGRQGMRTQQWLSEIAHTEWTLAEIQAGDPFTFLQ